MPPPPNLRVGSRPASGSKGGGRPSSGTSAKLGRTVHTRAMPTYEARVRAHSRANREALSSSVLPPLAFAGGGEHAFGSEGLFPVAPDGHFPGEFGLGFEPPGAAGGLDANRCEANADYVLEQSPTFLAEQWPSAREEDVFAQQQAAFADGGLSSAYSSQSPLKLNTTGSSSSLKMKRGPSVKYEEEPPSLTELVRGGPPSPSKTPTTKRSRPNTRGSHASADGVETFDMLFSPEIAKEVYTALETVERLAEKTADRDPHGTHVANTENRISKLLRAHPVVRHKLEVAALEKQARDREREHVAQTFVTAGEETTGGFGPADMSPAFHRADLSPTFSASAHQHPVEATPTFSGENAVGGSVFAVDGGASLGSSGPGAGSSREVVGAGATARFDDQGDMRSPSRRSGTRPDSRQMSGTRPDSRQSSPGKSRQRELLGGGAHSTDSAHLVSILPSAEEQEAAEASYREHLSAMEYDSPPIQHLALREHLASRGRKEGSYLPNDAGGYVTVITAAGTTTTMSAAVLPASLGGMKTLGQKMAGLDGGDLLMDSQVVDYEVAVAREVERQKWQKIESMMGTKAKQRQYSRNEYRMKQTFEKNRAKKIKLKAELEQMFRTAADKKNGGDTLPEVVQDERNKRIERPASKNRTFKTEKRDVPRLNKVPIAEEFRRSDLGFAEPRLVQQMQGVFSPKSAPYYIALRGIKSAPAGAAVADGSTSSAVVDHFPMRPPASGIEPPQLSTQQLPNGHLARRASKSSQGSKEASKELPPVDHFPKGPDDLTLRGSGWKPIARNVHFREEVSQVFPRSQMSSPSASASRVVSPAEDRRSQKAANRKAGAPPPAESSPTAYNSSSPSPPASQMKGPAGASSPPAIVLVNATPLQATRSPSSSPDGRPRSMGGVSLQPLASLGDIARPNTSPERLVRSPALDALAQPKKRPNTAFGENLLPTSGSGRLHSARGHFDEALVESMTPQRGEPRPGSRMNRSGYQPQVPSLAPKAARLHWTKNFLARRGQSGEAAADEDNPELPPMSPTTSAIARVSDHQQSVDNFLLQSLDKSLSDLDQDKLDVSLLSMEKMLLSSQSENTSPRTGKTSKQASKNTSKQTTPRTAVQVGGTSERVAEEGDATASRSPRLTPKKEAAPPSHWVEAVSWQASPPEVDEFGFPKLGTGVATASSSSRPVSRGVAVVSSGTSPREVALGAEGTAQASFGSVDGGALIAPGEPTDLPLGSLRPGSRSSSHGRAAAPGSPSSAPRHGGSRPTSKMSPRRLSKDRVVASRSVADDGLELPEDRERLLQNAGASSGGGGQGHVAGSGQQNKYEVVSYVEAEDYSVEFPYPEKVEVSIDESTERVAKVRATIMQEIEKKTKPHHLLEHLRKETAGLRDRIQEYMSFPLYKRQPNPVELEHQVEMDIWLRKNWNRKETWQLPGSDPVDRFLSRNLHKTRGAS